MAGFLFTALVGRRLGKQAHWIPVGVIFAAWVIAMVASSNVLTGRAPLLPGPRTSTATSSARGPGSRPATSRSSLGFFVDPLTACLLIVVTTIGLLVHIYSIGYMSHDPGYWRFFAYLNLFMFSMLLLVLADSWLVVFVAWELVGLSSYLLIGFWYRKRSAALAAKKAFIVNRVGDVGFALGIMAIFVNTGTLDDPRVARHPLLVDRRSCACADPDPADRRRLLVFAGAMGKSAQFPLHVWLPDAMEGPTPVSALIHAATMVNAGVYLVARSNLLFASAPDAMVIVAAIGIFTAILAATIAMTQTDIKRVLAYSTLSQLGYMFAALGVGAFTAAIFHLMTHGFFKGLLFLGSGLGDPRGPRGAGHAPDGRPVEEDPDHLLTMLIGSIAIAGHPAAGRLLLEGRDPRRGLQARLPRGSGRSACSSRCLTAFYMFRLMGLTFWGEFRGPKELWDRIHESPPVMTVAAHPAGHPVAPPRPVPRAAARRQHDLAAGSSRSSQQADELLGHAEAEYQLFGIDGVLIVASVTVAAVGIALAWRLFGIDLGGLHLPARPERGPRDQRAARACRSCTAHRSTSGGSTTSTTCCSSSSAGGSRTPLWWFDREVVDGTVNGIGSAAVVGRARPPPRADRAGPELRARHRDRAAS